MENKVIDVVLDTDAFNEVDDQYAISFMLRSSEKLNPVAIYAAPFLNAKSESAKDGMEKSYNEIMHILELNGRDDFKGKVFKGSEAFLESETQPFVSEAALDLVERAKNYSKESPLYVVAIGAITNIASAFLIDKSIGEKIVLVWLGGHARHYHDTKEFNMRQDYKAARIVMEYAENFVQLPCMGVVSAFRLTSPELEAYMRGKNELCDYLTDKTLGYVNGGIKSKAIWDVTAIAYLLNDGEKFMKTREVDVILPSDEGFYEKKIDKKMKYVYYIDRDPLMSELINKLTK